MDVQVVEGARHLVVRATGLLDLHSGPVLQDVLLRAAAEQPRGLVCDLAEAGATREGLAVLHVVADQVADWPSSPLALVASAPPLLDELERLGLRRRLPVVPTLAQAASALRITPRLLRATTVLAPTTDAPAAARAFTGAALTRWQAPSVVEGARWVVSELVTNAVVHARSDVTVRVSLTGRRVCLAVADRGQGGEVRPDGGEGRGLRVVERLTRSWGSLPRLRGGTVVWAVLDVDAPVSTVLPQQAWRRA
jgi:hypothetical protein